MAMDPVKAKIESLRKSIQKIEDQLLLLKGNKIATDSLTKIKERFEKDIQTLKTQ